MAVDLQLDDTQDLVINNGDIGKVQDGNEVIQSFRIRCLHILGEWVFDYTLGMPWFTEMFATNVSELQKKANIQKVITETPGFRRLLRIEFAVDPIEKGAQIDFSADTDYGVISTELTI